MNFKKTLIAAAAASLLGSASFVVASSSRNSKDDLFKANVEALSQPEIIVGSLCIECKNAACTSLDEVFIDFYPA